MNPLDTCQEDAEFKARNRDPMPRGEPSPSLDRITKLAACFFQAPIAAIICTSEGGIRCRSLTGLDNPKSFETTSRCTHLISGRGTLVIADASIDPSFQNDPLVTSPPHIRFYAQAPLVTPDGREIGVFSIADVAPRSAFGDVERAALEAFAGLTADMLNLCPPPRNATSPKATVSSLIADMGHEIRTPMNGVLGMAELLLAADDLDNRQRRRVEIIKRSGAALLSLLDHIVDLAKIDTEGRELDATPFDLSELVSELQLRDVGEALRLEVVDRLGGHHRVLGDAARVRRLLSGFLESAAKFAAEGTIRVVASADPAPPGKVRVHVEAENASIDTSAVERVLTADSKDERSHADRADEADLTLAISDRLAKRMGGRVGVVHTPGDVPALSLDILLDSDSGALPPSPESEDRPTLRPDAGQHTSADVTWDILVAEDDPDMALLIEDFLDDAGHRATIARDGSSALRILEGRHFDAVLMDGHMPDMTGFDVAKVIRQLPNERADIPIIALTGEALARDRYLSAGMDDYILKPVDSETLIDTIDRCCSKRQAGRRQTSTPE